METSDGVRIHLRPYHEETVDEMETFLAEIDEQTGAIEQKGERAISTSIVRFEPISLRIEVSKFIALAEMIIRQSPKFGPEGLVVLRKALDAAEAEVVK